MLFQATVNIKVKVNFEFPLLGVNPLQSEVIKSRIQKDAFEAISKMHDSGEFVSDSLVEDITTDISLNAHPSVFKDKNK